MLLLLQNLIAYPADTGGTQYFSSTELQQITNTPLMAAQIKKSAAEFHSHPDMRYVGDYGRKCLDKVLENFKSSYPDKIKGISFSTELSIEVLPNGQVRSFNIKRSSGNSQFDKALLDAVKLAAPFESFSLEMQANADVFVVTSQFIATSPSDASYTFGTSPFKIIAVGIPPDAGFPLSELKFNKIFAERPDKNSAGESKVYCLLGNGFFRTLSSNEQDSMIQEWVHQHPNARAIPVSIIAEGTKHSITYIWGVDGEDNLNLSLIKNGALPASVMFDAVHYGFLTKNSPENALIEAGAVYARKLHPGLPEAKENPPKRLISGSSYAKFLIELKKADDIAQSQKVGIWSDKFKDMRQSTEDAKLAAPIPDTTISSASSTKEIRLHVNLQPWQQRRSAFAKTVQGVRNDDLLAKKDFDAVLTEFETHAFSRTPMENMELLGVFYVPKDGIEISLSIVIANAVLGWYDALRFASESGRAEIINNEGFFKKAIVVGGSDITNKAVQFLQNNPDKVAKSLAQGLSFADKYRGTANYDRHWPSGYGLERTICALNGVCKDPQSMPQDQWDKAWEDAKSKVTSYYQVAKPSSASESSTVVLH